MCKQDTTTASERRVLKNTTPSNLQIIQKVYDHFSTDLKPHLYKLTLVKDLLLYADLNEMSIQENFDDVCCGLDLIFGETISGFQTFQDNLSAIYREVTHE